MINRLEQALNRVSDQDWSWWPLLALRPASYEPVTPGILFRLLVCFGALSGAVIVLLLLAYQVPVTPLRVVFSLLFGGFGYLLIYGGSFVWAWNRRAARLLAEADSFKVK